MLTISHIHTHSHTHTHTHTLASLLHQVLQAAALSSHQVSAKRHAIAQLTSIKSRVSVKLDPLHVATHNTSLGSITRDKTIHREEEGNVIATFAASLPIRVLVLNPI